MVPAGRTRLVRSLSVSSAMSSKVHDQRAVFIDSVGLHGVLGSPARATATIILAFARANGRLGPRNNQLAEGLRGAGFATLLVDLLSQREEGDPALAEDVELLTARLSATADWLGETLPASALPVGYLGNGLGAAVVLRVASTEPRKVQAIVCCGGRPDLAVSSALSRVRAPVQLIVGGRDVAGLKASREAMDDLRCVHELAIVPNAHRHFEDPGAIDSVAGHAARWFHHHLA